MIWDNLKSPNKSILMKKKEKRYRKSGIPLFTILKTLDSYLYLKPILAKNQLWTSNSTSVIEVKKIAAYNMRRACVTIDKYSVKKPPYIQIRLFIAKENEAMKQVAYVNYTLNEFKELSQILVDFMFVDNCKLQ